MDTLFDIASLFMAPSALVTIWFFFTALMYISISYGNDGRPLLFAWMLSLGASCFLVFRFDIQPLIVVFLLVFPCGFLLAYYMGKLNVRLAKKLVEDRLRLYQSKFEAVEIDPSDFPWVDMEFYETYTTRLAEIGFHKVKDGELRHLTLANPEIPFFTRVFLNADQTIWCCISQQRYARPKNRAEKNFSISSISFCSELSDGIYLLTGNLKGVMLRREIAGIVSQEFTPDTPLEELFRHHEELIQRNLSEGNLHLLPYVAEDAGRRAFELLREDMRKHGIFTEAELQQLAEMNGHTKHFLEFPLTKKMHELSEKLSTEMFQEFSSAPQP